MNFLEHVALLVAGLAGFAIWPSIRRPSTQMSDTVHGIPCNFKQRKASRSNRVTVTVTVPCDERFEFMLRREQFFDRLAKALHLVQEFQTRDERFDAAVYIGADESGIHGWLAQDADSRRQFLDLLALEPEKNTRVRSIAASRGVLSLSALAKPRTFSSAPGDLAVTVATATVPMLKSCVDRLQAFAASDADPAAFQDPFAATIRTLSSLYLGLILVPIALSILIQLQPPRLQLVTNPLFDRDTLAVVAVVLGTLLALVFLLLRGSSRLHTVLAPLLLCGAVGALFVAPALIREVNAEWDHSTPQRYSAQVLRLYVTHGRNSTSYHVWLSDWHSQSDHQDLQVDAATYDELSAGETVTVSERDGYLGRRWVSDLTAAAPSGAGNP